jgi:hypothetical protein
MSLPARCGDRTGLARRFARLWREWIRTRKAVAKLDRCGPVQTANVAHDIGMTGRELRTLAGKWPDSGDLLALRMQGLDLTSIEPEVMRDLQRVCTLCDGKSKCRRDFATNPLDPAWERYCPNAPTFAALVAERAGGSKTMRT